MKSSLNELNSKHRSVVCTYCARLAAPGYAYNHGSTTVLDYHPNVHSLLQSRKTCPLCDLFVSLFQSNRLEDIVTKASNGARTAVIIRWRQTSHQLLPPEKILSYATLRRVEILAGTQTPIDLRSPEFKICTKYGLIATSCQIWTILTRLKENGQIERLGGAPQSSCHFLNGSLW